MGLKVIGAGFPRTGTTSLQAALEQLLGERCYHMFDMRGNPTHPALWTQALDGDLSALDQVLDGFSATIDWPASLFWHDLLDQYPDALVVLSHRGDAETWWKSANRTVWDAMRQMDNSDPANNFHAKMRAKAGLGDDWDDPTAMKGYYDALYAQVVDTVPADRLVTWQPSDGWEPLCAALGVPVPDQEFAHLNATADFRKKLGLDESPSAT